MTSPHETGQDRVQDQPTPAAPPAEPAPAQPAAAQPAEPARPAPPAEPAAPRATSPAVPGPGWSGTTGSRPAQDATTVLPGAGHPAPPRAAAARPASARSEARPGSTRPVATRGRRARLTWKRIDPWSVFLFSLVASVFLGIALIVAAAVLYAVLGVLGVTESLNQLYAEVTGGDVATEALLTSGRILGFAAVLALVNVVFLTLLATLGAMLYNLCASFTGGLELTFGERD